MAFFVPVQKAPKLRIRSLCKRLKTETAGHVNPQIPQCRHVNLRDGEYTSRVLDGSSLLVDAFENRQDNRLHQVVVPVFVGPLVPIEVAFQDPRFEKVLSSREDTPMAKEPPRAINVEGILAPRLVSLSTDTAELNGQHCTCASPNGQALTDEYRQRLLGCCFPSHILFRPTMIRRTRIRCGTWVSCLYNTRLIDLPRLRQCLWPQSLASHAMVYPGVLWGST